MEMERETERVLVADLLRVVAILLVLLSHVLISLGAPWAEAGQPRLGIFPFVWNTWGEIGVTLFLILSGFGLGYRYRGAPVDFRPFYFKRIVRIYPIYYFSLLFALTLHAAFAFRGSFAGGQAFQLLPGFGYFDVVLALTGLNAFFGKWGGPLVGSSWFVGLIMFLYLLYPLLSDGFKRSPWRFLMLLFFVSTASRLLIAGSNLFDGNPMLWFPLNRVFEFGIGVAFGQRIRRDVLTKFNPGLRKIPFLSFFSDLSFPLFLIHDPLRRFIGWGPQTFLFQSSSLFVFVALSFFLSVVALEVNKRVACLTREKYRVRLGFLN